MRYNMFGDTGIKIANLTLGTMTFGEQTSMADAHRQLDISYDAGINLVDAAEMYPVPPRAPSYGKTEEIIGQWLAANPAKRAKLLIATKAAGPGSRVNYIRPDLYPDGPRLDRPSLTRAIETSLQRLRLDVVDFYQMHWPDRNTNFFDQLGFVARDHERMTAIDETLSTLADLVKQGKIRYIGVSNETPWGVYEYLRLAKEKSWPRIQAIQNPYNLLKRDYEVGMAEISWREKIGLLAYSPLAMGALTGKYLHGARPEGARMTLFGQYFSRYLSPRANRMCEAYVDLAKRHGLNPSQMALAFVAQQPFVTSAIFGARTADQLVELLPAAEMIFSNELWQDIAKLHQQEPVGY